MGGWFKISFPCSLCNSFGIIFRYNATVFAYGATGAGKTHTMVGDRHNPGIMIRALNDIFETVKDKEDEYSVSDNSKLLPEN